MVERPQADDHRYLERMIAHLDHHVTELLAQRRMDVDTLDRITRVVGQTPTKGDILSVVKAVEVLESRQNENRELLRGVAQKVTYVAAVAAIVAGALIKNANLRDLFPF